MWAGRRRARAVPLPVKRRRRVAHAQCRPQRPLSPQSEGVTREPWPLRAAVFSGSWGSSCCPLPSRLGSRAPSASPARRGRSRAARPSRLCRLCRRRPRASLPPGSGECLAAVAASGTLSRPSASVHSGAPVSVLSVVPRAPLFVPLFHSSVCSQDGQPLPPSLVASFVCLLPPARPLWDLGQRCSAPWDSRTRRCLQSSPPPKPRDRCRTMEAVPLLCG